MTGSDLATAVAPPAAAVPAHALPPNAKKGGDPKALAESNAKTAQEHRSKAMDIIKQARVKAGGEPAAAPQAAAPAEPTTPARDESGKFAKVEAGEPTAPSTEAKAETVGKHDKGEYEKAVTALLKTKAFSSEEVAAMPPDLVMSKYKAVREHQATLDRTYQDGHNARKELEAARLRIAEFEKQQATAKGSNQTAQDGSPPLDLKSAAQPISDKLKSLLGDDVEVESELEQFATTILSSAQGALEQIRADNKALENRMNTILDEQVKPDLSKKFPQLKELSAWEAVRQKADGLLKAGIVDDRQSALRSAAAMEYGLEAAEEAQKTQRAIDQAKKNGQPYSGSQSDSPPPPTKPEDRQKAFLKLVRSGKSAEEANRSLGMSS